MVSKRMFFAVSAFVGLAVAVAPQATLRATEPQGAGFQQALEDAYNRLTAMKEWNPADDLKLKTEIQKLTEEYILTRLNGEPRPPAASLENDLNQAFSQGIGHMSSEQLRKFWGDVHYASVLEPSPPANLYVIGFMIPHGNSSLDVIDVAQQVSGVYRFTAQGGREMQGHTLRLTPMRSPSVARVRFLAYGARLGANQSPLGVVLYQFDGKSLLPLWTRDGLWQGTVKVEADTVILMFQDTTHLERGTPPYFLKEEYTQTQASLKLRSRGWADAP